ncbi:MAG: MOSC domain-containing protein [Thermoplasmata archaeon]|nr:MOSC domain-containing protein [Thermoplasmata archaeon]
MTGTVERIGVKGDVPNETGLPKPSVAYATVRAPGLDGDYNHYRQQELHGDLDSAVLLLTAETLEELNRDGWPVKPGDLGENLTVRGLPVDSLGPGARLAAGEVEIEIRRSCDPCRNLFGLPYVGSERGPAFLRATLGRRGWYGRVLREGSVRVGDRIEVVRPRDPPTVRARPV